MPEQWNRVDKYNISIRDVTMPSGERDKYDSALKKWTSMPKLKKCCQGDQREWHIKVGVSATSDAGTLIETLAYGTCGVSYMNQLFCRYHEVFINPSGVACTLCEARTWPKHVNSRRLVEECLSRDGKQAAGELLIVLVEKQEIDAGRASEIVDALNLEI